MPISENWRKDKGLKIWPELIESDPQGNILFPERAQWTQHVQTLSLAKKSTVGIPPGPKAKAHLPAVSLLLGQQGLPNTRTFICLSSLPSWQLTFSLSLIFSLSGDLAKPSKTSVWSAPYYRPVMEVAQMWKIKGVRGQFQGAPPGLYQPTWVWRFYLSPEPQSCHSPCSGLPYLGWKPNSQETERPLRCK